MREYVTVVSGMPRSGTSLTMQMLGAGGMPLLADHRRSADAHNLRGYFEYEPAKRLAENSAWVENAKGRAVKIIYRLLRHLPGEIEYRVLFLERDLVEIFESQQDMLRSKNHPAANQDRARILPALAAELAATKEWLAHRSNMQVLAVPYAEVLCDAGKWAREISHFLDGLNAPAMAAAVDPS